MRVLVTGAAGTCSRKAELLPRLAYPTLREGLVLL